jgi:hypothetical protein
MSIKEMLGTRFGKLIVTKRAENLKDGTAVWACLCDCGAERNVAGTKLRAGRQKSCGCASPKFNSKLTTTHGMSKTRVYKIWAGMITRCNNPSSEKLKRLYSNKGIEVCERWKLFENFFQDMGDAPIGASIDRIDGSKNYEPSNCRWATSTEQANNTTRNRLIEHDNKKMTIAMWARHLGVKPNTLIYRLKRGQPVEQALK